MQDIELVLASQRVYTSHFANVPRPPRLGVDRSMLRLPVTRSTVRMATHIRRASFH